MSEVKRTRWRIVNLKWELENVFHLDLKNLPDRMEVLPDGFHVVTYLTEEEAKERDGQLFPKCPITGAFCTWDYNYTLIGDLF